MSLLKPSGHYKVPKLSRVWNLIQALAFLTTHETINTFFPTSLCVQCYYSHSRLKWSCCCYTEHAYLNCILKRASRNSVQIQFRVALSIRLSGCLKWSSSSNQNNHRARGCESIHYQWLAMLRQCAKGFGGKCCVFVMIIGPVCQVER